MPDLGTIFTIGFCAIAWLATRGADQEIIDRFCREDNDRDL